MHAWPVTLTEAFPFHPTSLLCCLVGPRRFGGRGPAGKAAHGGGLLSGMLRCPVTKRAALIASSYAVPGHFQRQRRTKPRSAQADYLGWNRPRRAAWRWVKRDLGLRFDPVAAKLWETGTRNAAGANTPDAAQGIIAPTTEGSG